MCVSEKENIPSVQVKNKPLIEESKHAVIMGMPEVKL
jgi:hypothetical protein